MIFNYAETIYSLACIQCLFMWGISMVPKPYPFWAKMTTNNIQFNVRFCSNALSSNNGTDKVPFLKENIFHKLC